MNQPNPFNLIATEDGRVRLTLYHTPKNNVAQPWTLRFSFFQIITGSLSIIFQIVAIVLEGKKEKDPSGYYLVYKTVERWAPGIWVGVVICCSGIIGFLSSTTASKPKVGAHLGLNILLLAIIPILLTVPSVSVAGIQSCLSQYPGETQVFWKTTTTTASSWRYDKSHRSSKLSPYYKYEPLSTTEEYILGYPRSSYCRTPFFYGWLAMDCLLLIIAITNYVLAIVFIPINSVNLCRSCCRCCHEEHGADYNGQVHGPYNGSGAV